MTKPIKSKIFKFGGLTMQCHVLAEGQRVIDAKSVAEFMEWFQNGKCLNPQERGFRAFVAWQKGAMGLDAEGRLIEKS